MAAANVRRAAELIVSADILLIAAGAGFSADSGLPVYNDIANMKAYEELGLEYHDLCDPYWLEEDAELFLGFWGSCVNMYRSSSTHEGYDILKRWKARVSSKQGIQDAFTAMFSQLSHQGSLPSGVSMSNVTMKPFFVYTSNVDAHFLRHFEPCEVYEIHGNIEQWQCAGHVGAPTSRPCEGVWRLPKNYSFNLNHDTMRAKEPDDCVEKRFPRCSECKKLARPNVLMFHDRQWIANTHDEHSYVAWEAMVEHLLAEQPQLKLVVLEVGCGTRVPSVRLECEMVVEDAFLRCNKRPDQVHLVRINPEFLSCDNETVNDHNLLVPLKMGALEALRAIDIEMERREGLR